MSEAWWFIPGFLGDESHFGELISHFPNATILNLTEFADAYDLKSAAQLIAQKSLSSGLTPHLVGYSLGGRLALHAALVAPGTFKTVTALSSHPGFRDETEKSERINEDKEWAQLLLQNWNEFWNKWNARGVLRDSPVPKRNEPFDKDLWAKILINWSTGHQNYLPPLLVETLLPLNVIMGEEDKAYLEHLKLFPDNVKKTILSHASHRIPLERPQELAQELKTFAQENQ